MTQYREIHTRIADPYCRRASVWTLNVESVPSPDGRYSYRPKDPTKQWAFAALQRNYPYRYGCVEVAVVSHDAGVDGMPDGLSCVEWLKRGRYSDTVCWIAGPADNRGSLFHELQYSPGRDITVTLLGVAFYETDDWAIIDQLMTAGKIPIPWTAPPMSAASGVQTLPVLIP